MKLKVYNGSANEEIEISPVISNAKPNDTLLAQVIRANLANLRESNAHSKNRGEVSGGGRKPFKQKGTGRARAGSSRSPLWTGGGVTFGPRNNRNYSQRLPQKMSASATRVVLSEKLKNNKFLVVKNFDFDKISTKQMQSFLEKLPIEEGMILVVLAKTNVNLELSASNLGYIKTVQIAGVKLLDLLKYDYLLTDIEGVKAIEARYDNTEAKKVASKEA